MHKKKEGRRKKAKRKQPFKPKDSLKISLRSMKNLKAKMKQIACKAIFSRLFIKIKGEMYEGK